MEAQTSLAEKEFEQEIIQELKDYQALKGQEGAVVQALTAAQLSAEIKEAMGLDLFPEDIQNDILALSQKIADYTLNLVEQSGEEGVPSMPYGQRLVNCMADLNSRAILRDAWKDSSRAAKLAIGPLKPFKTAIRFGAAGASMLGASTGSVIGCMQRNPWSTRPPAFKPFGR